MIGGGTRERARCRRQHDGGRPTRQTLRGRRAFRLRSGLGVFRPARVGIGRVLRHIQQLAVGRRPSRRAHPRRDHRHRLAPRKTRLREKTWGIVSLVAVFVEAAALAFMGFMQHAGLCTALPRFIACTVVAGAVIVACASWLRRAQGAVAGHGGGSRVLRNGGKRDRAVRG